MAEQIVLFGGTFDPVHVGHLIVARALAETCGFERITFVPAARPPHKTAACAAAEHRLAMLRLAVAGEEVFDICELELHRTGPSYTFETLGALQRQQGGEPTMHWVIGADMLADLPNWHRVKDVLAMARIVVATRPPWHQRLEELFAALSGVFSDRQVALLRQSVVRTPLIDISSSDIRSRVAAGRSIRHLVPETVRTYLFRHRLYPPQAAGLEATAP